MNDYNCIHIALSSCRFLIDRSQNLYHFRRYGAETIDTQSSISNTHRHIISYNKPMVILVLILVSKVTCADESSTNITRTQQYDISDLYVNESRYLRHLLRQIIYFLSYETVNIAVFSVVNSDFIVGAFSFAASFRM